MTGSRLCVHRCLDRSLRLLVRRRRDMGELISPGRLELLAPLLEPSRGLD